MEWIYLDGGSVVLQGYLGHGRLPLRYAGKERLNRIDPHRKEER
jgi:hypothetical protein